MYKFFHVIFKNLNFKITDSKIHFSYFKQDNVLLMICTTKKLFSYVKE